MSRLLFHGLQYSGLTDGEKTLAVHFDDFAKSQKLDSLAFEIDKTGVIPARLLRAFRDAGFFGFPIPVEYGGFGGTFVESSLFGKHIGGSCFAVANVVGAHGGVCTLPIVRFGTEKQKQRYLPKLASGEWIGAFGVTEAAAGANPEYTNCTARPEGRGFIINGVKTYISNGPIASLVLTLARTDDSHAGRDGLSFFLVESSCPGFSIGQSFEPKMGMAGVTVSEILLDEVRVGPSQLLGGAQGQGWNQLQFALEHSRLGLSSACLGMAHSTLEASVRHLGSRTIGPSTRAVSLSEFEAVQGSIVDMAATVAAMEAVVFETARRIDSSTASGHLATMTKVFCSRSLGHLLREARLLYGGSSYFRGNLIERLSREQPVSEIYEGTNVLLQLLVASEASSKEGAVRFVENSDLGPLAGKVEDLRATLQSAYQCMRVNKVRRHQTPCVALGEATAILYAAECVAKDSHAAARRNSPLAEIREGLAARFCESAERRLNSIADGVRVFDGAASDEQERVSSALFAGPGG